MKPPRIGQPVLLVYRECPCGEWLATAEGAVAPQCRRCNGFFVPGGGPKEGDEPMFGRSVQEARLVRCLGFAAVLTSESGAILLLKKVRSFLGFDTPTLVEGIEERSSGSNGNHYTENERQAASDEIKAALDR